MTAADLPVFFEHQCDPEATRMAAFKPRTLEAFMQHWRQRVLGNERACNRTIIVEGRVAGYVLSWDQDGARCLGYWLGRDFWGRGVATAALREFLGEEQTRPLRAHVAVHNVGSIRVLEKCGLRRVGEPTRGADGVEELLFEL